MTGVFTRRGSDTGRCQGKVVRRGPSTSQAEVNRTRSIQAETRRMVVGLHKARFLDEPSCVRLAARESSVCARPGARHRQAPLLLTRAPARWYFHVKRTASAPPTGRFRGWRAAPVPNPWPSACDKTEAPDLLLNHLSCSYDFLPDESRWIGEGEPTQLVSLWGNPGAPCALTLAETPLQLQKAS